MKIGISTYAYRWEFSDKTDNPISLMGMLEKTKKFGAEVFQICDYSPIESMSIDELKEFAEEANKIGIELELGTQGVYPEHLRKYLTIAEALRAKVLRSMIHGGGHAPSIDQAIDWLKEVASDFEKAGVSIALETYEPVKSADLVRVSKEVASPFIGICLDPGNSISELEFPEDVIKNTVPYVTNLHVKDFIFKRNEGTVGFILTGCPLGEGQLNLNFMLETLEKAGKRPNAIIELWLPFLDTLEETTSVQDVWIQKSVHNMEKEIAKIASIANY